MCFSLAWLAQLLIWVVVIVALVAILKAVIPWALAKFGATVDPIVWRICDILLWACIIVVAIIIIFSILSCLLGGGPLTFPRFR